jgi:hypothetical protein
MYTVLRIAGRSLLAILATLLACLLLDALVLFAPKLTHRLLSAPAKAQCESLKQGLDLNEVIYKIDGHFPAQYQVLRRGSLEFVQRIGGGSCVVEFNESTGKVTRTQFDVSGPPQFDLRGLD